jgi:hypothetical protein
MLRLSCFSFPLDVPLALFPECESFLLAASGGRGIGLGVKGADGMKQGVSPKRRIASS